MFLGSFIPFNTLPHVHSEMLWGSLPIVYSGSRKMTIELKQSEVSVIMFSVHLLSVRVLYDPDGEG